MDDFLSSESEMIVSTHFYMSIADEHELDTYVCYLTYRLQRDLYDVCKEGGELDDIPWSQFVWIMRHVEELRDMAAMVARETLKEFRRNGHLNFEVEHVELLNENDKEDEKDERIYSSRIFSAEEGRALVKSILLKAEMEQYKRQLEKGKAYSWEDFLAELVQDKSLWNEVLMAFRDALARIDFKPLCRSDCLDELI